MFEPAMNTVLIILLEITIDTEVIAYKACYNFTFRESSLTIYATFPIAIIGWQTQFFNLFNIQILVKLIKYKVTKKTNETTNFYKDLINPNSRFYDENSAFIIRVGCYRYDDGIM